MQVGQGMRKSFHQLNYLRITWIGAKIQKYSMTRKLPTYVKFVILRKNVFSVKLPIQ